MGLFSRQVKTNNFAKNDNAINSQSSSSLSFTDQLLNALQEGACILDKNGVVLSCNDALAKISGFAPAEACRLHFKTVLHFADNDSQPIDDSNNPVLIAVNSNQKFDSDDFYLIQKSGKKIPISIHITPIHHNNIVNILLIIKDIESSRQLLEQKTEFISTASHEMRTPVTAIDGYLSLIANPATATIDERAQNYVTKARKSTKHLSQLFQDLLDTAKSDENQLKFNLEPIDVIEITKRATEELVPTASAKGLSLTFSNNQHPQPNFLVKADQSRFLEILHNLIDNAIKYTNQGSITLSVTGDANKVTITISDTGIGIKESELPHLFQKFSRIDNSDTREIGGTGLGLYIVKQLAEKMNGRVTVQSTYGKGSSFIVEFPRLSVTQAKFLDSNTIN